MTDKAPSVSVVIPTYNRSALVAKTADSVLNQQFTDYKIIVVDDGSANDTKETLNKYGDRIRYVYQDNSGVSAARNTGIAAARGKWLAFLDSDYEWKPDYLATQITQANRNPCLCMQSANCLFTAGNCDTRTYFEINGVIAAVRDEDYLFIKGPFSFVVAHGPWQVRSTIFLRDATNKAGSSDTHLTLDDDFDCMARVSLQGPLGLIREESVNIFSRDESTECLTNQVKKDPLGARESDERIYEKLKLIQTLNYKERKTLKRVMSANRRAIGNLVLQTGDTQGARDCYKRALFIESADCCSNLELLQHERGEGTSASGQCQE